MKRFTRMLAVAPAFRRPRCTVMWLISMFFCLCISAQTQQQSSSEIHDRFFLPRDMFWGYGQFDLAPPHNEIDPNLCSSLARNYGGPNAPCSEFGRYMLSAYVEVRPFGTTQLRRLFLFGEPRFLFGKTVPQARYTWSPDAIGWERSWGAGIYLGRGFEIRVTQHFLFSRLGARDRYLGPADLGPNGPWGRFNTIGVRKYFGQRRY